MYCIHSPVTWANVGAQGRGGWLAARTVILLMLAFALTVAVMPSANAARAPGLAAIPARYLALYRQAARTCPGLTWEVLAGIGTMESGNGRSRARGVHRGKNRKGAEGPMQFEPATFAEYAVRADRSGRLTPYNPADAIFTAARMLCADGAAGGSAPGLRRAIYAYNHACRYVRDVLALAARFQAEARARHRPARHHARHRPARARHRPARHHAHRPPKRHHRPGPARAGHRRAARAGLCAGQSHAAGYGR